MCGIFAYITRNNKNSEKFENSEWLSNISKKIKHRGPDNTSTLSFKVDNTFFYLSFHRLSIVNSSENGNQPFVYHHKLQKIILLCNGEIYNHKELIEKYNLSSTGSDCHCIIELYLKFGIHKTLEVIQNEYAFILIDINEYVNSYKIYCSRDRFGIRPLFYSFQDDTFIASSELKSVNPFYTGNVFPPRQYCVLNNLQNIQFFKYYGLDQFPYNNHMISDSSEISEKIRNILTNSVKDRLQADENIQIGCLLSGGLDSSLISAICSKIMKTNGVKLRTFSIGFKNSEDLKYAKLVSEYIDSEHTEVLITPQDALDQIDNIIYTLETYDITTIRASIFQYLICKYIKENTNIKVLLVGDGSDELFNGYKYNYFNDDPIKAHYDTIDLLNNIHYYDVLRCDRGVSSNGLECRAPFLSTELVEYILKIDPNLRMPNNHKIEKFILREAFKDEFILPYNVLFRKKEAFSDGVSDSTSDKYWFEIIKEYVENKEFISKKYEHLSPISKESEYYRYMFEIMFPKNEMILQKYWMPKFVENKTDPSAKTL